MPLDSEWHLLSNIEMLPEADLMALDEDLRWDQDIQQTSSTGISGGLSHPCTLSPFPPLQPFKSAHHAAAHRRFKRGHRPPVALPLPPRSSLPRLPATQTLLSGPPAV